MTWQARDSGALPLDYFVPPSLRRASGYGVAAVAVVATLALKTMIPWLGEVHPFLLLPVGIAVAAWYGGAGPAIAATIASTIGVDVFFIPPLEVGVDTDIPALLALLVEGLLITWVTVELRRARWHAKSEAIVADRQRREAVLALAMREELLGVWAAKLRGPLSDFMTIVDEARLAHRSGDHARTGLALEQLRRNAALLRRTAEGSQSRDVPAADDW